MSLTDAISLPPPWWNISTSTGCLHNCKTTPRTCNGWKFSTHLPLRRISTYLAHLLLPFALQGLVRERVTDVLPALESFFGESLAVGTLSREPLSSLLLRDSSQVAQRPKSPNRITHQCFHTLLVTFRHFLVLFCLSTSWQAKQEAKFIIRTYLKKTKLFKTYFIVFIIYLSDSIVIY